MKLSEKLIKLRKEKKLSQEEFGNEISVSRQAVSKWENEETKPDIDKIQEIVKKFDVSYEYLLNDEIESEEEITKKDKVCKKSKKKTILKILLSLLIIYLLISVYKFIAFTRFYLVANSFSEENYWMDTGYESVTSMGERMAVTFGKRKYENKILETSYNFDEQYAIKDEEDVYMPFKIKFTDKENKICYDLYYDKDTQKYIYTDLVKTAFNDEEREDLFKDDYNDIKETTLSHIPSGFKEIFLASIDPRYYYVSIFNNEIMETNFLGIKTKINLNGDCIINSTDLRSDFDGNISATYSYDYVPDHQKDIVSPIESETYKDKIIFEEQ